MQRLELVEPDQSKYIALNQNDDLIRLLPYVKIKGEWTLSADVMRGIWQQLKDEGIAQLVFNDGSLINSVDFINFFQHGRNLAVIVFSGNEVIGIAWMNNVRRNHAFGHFAFFKSAWGKLTERAGRTILQYWFAMPGPNNGYLFDFIIGMVDSRNRRALQYIKRLGFTQIGEIPKMMYDARSREFKPATLNYIER